MFEITKQFDFSAAHHLNGLPKEHPCGRVHGHNYRVEMVLRSDSLDRRGFVVDYGELDQFEFWLKRNFDHQDLNTLIEQPTAENLAKLFFDQWSLTFGMLEAVRVSETQNTWAEYRPGRPAHYHRKSERET